jgi:hypothetical protein
MLQKGIFSNSVVKRKEIGISYNLNNFLFDFSISNSVGKSFNIGYIIAFN